MKNKDLNILSCIIWCTKCASLVTSEYIQLKLLIDSATDFIFHIKQYLRFSKHVLLQEEISYILNSFLNMFLFLVFSLFPLSCWKREGCVLCRLPKDTEKQYI